MNGEDQSPPELGQNSLIFSHRARKHLVNPWSWQNTAVSREFSEWPNPTCVTGAACKCLSPPAPFRQVLSPSCSLCHRLVFNSVAASFFGSSLKTAQASTASIPSSLRRDLFVSRFNTGCSVLVLPKLTRLKIWFLPRLSKAGWRERGCTGRGLGTGAHRSLPHFSWGNRKADGEGGGDVLEAMPGFTAAASAEHPPGRARGGKACWECQRVPWGGGASGGLDNPPTLYRSVCSPGAVLSGQGRS